jgi:hypothetical protein
MVLCSIKWISIYIHTTAFEIREAPRDYSGLAENGSGSDPGTYEDEHERTVGTYDYTFNNLNSTPKIILDL